MPDQREISSLIDYFTTAISFSRYVKTQIASVEPGQADLYIDVEDVHLNGNGTLHGGVYATLLDNAMGIAVAALVRVRVATTQMNVHFLGPVAAGRITCHGEVLHRTRRTATAEGKVFDASGNLVALATAGFRIFEQQGNPIV